MRVIRPYLKNLFGKSSSTQGAATPGSAHHHNSELVHQSGIVIDGEFVAFAEAGPRLRSDLRSKIARQLLVHPAVRHAEPTVLLSLDDEPCRPSQRLLDIAAVLAAEAPKAEHPLLSSRPGGGPRWFDVFPGEHYNLLTSLCRLLRAGTVWEFGTDTGMGTVALLEGLGSVGRVYTVDIDPISKKSDPWLSREDFESGRVVQVVSDMKAAEVFSQYTQQLADADLLFVDGPKDDVTEAAFLDLLPTVAFRKNPIIVFDDIRLINMLAVWRGIKRPKMDLTSFGHWSGTGLVDWKGVQLERGRI